MSKREKIIVGAMVVVILYGGYNFLFSGSSGPQKTFSPRKQVGVSEFVTGLITKIRGADTTATDTLILEKSAAAWQKDPFLVVREKTAAERAAEKEPEVIEREDLTAAFQYTGYMEMGPRKLAIINGMEYQEGEQLSDQGATLKKILPAEVRIYVDAGEGVIVVPIDETAR